MKSKDTLIPLSIVLKWIDDNLHDERILDDYRGIMVRGVMSSYTSIEELKQDITNIANNYEKDL